MPGCGDGRKERLMTSLYVTISHALLIKKLYGVELSLSLSAPLPAKDVTNSGDTSAHGRIEAHEHLARLVANGRIKQDQPVLLVSVRNVLSNLRAIGYSKMLSQPLAVEGEVFTERRPYHILGWDAAGRFLIREFTLGRDSTDGLAGYLSGVPVLWDEDDEQQLFRRLVSEAADHAHVWHLPRGRHPKATETSLQQWRDLHELFIAGLNASRESAASALINVAEAHGLKREHGYLHNILGVDDEGHLCQYIGIGCLEELGQRLRRQFGAKRALCVDNGGSVEVRLYPRGLSGFAVQLFAAPDFRPKGTAYLAIALPDTSFALLPTVSGRIQQAG